MNKKLCSSIFFFLTLCCFVLGYSGKSQTIPYPNFHENPLLDDPMRKLMALHLFPLDHQLKAKLDTIFSQSRATQNQKTLIDAGFVILDTRPISYITLARHPEIPGYIFKLYLDSEQRTNKGVPHWLGLARRCQGAKKIREVIKKKKLRHFIVPDKWLYILPPYPMSEESQPQPAILVETYIELGENAEQAWKTRIKRQHLDELYTIYKSGYGSVHVPGNIPYAKNGKFAFIDTESPKKDLKLKVVKKYLSKEMQQYWDYLIN